MSKREAKEGTSAHLVLQGKGGVGKSLVAFLLAQYFGDRKRTVQCYDTDPVNATLAKYKALNVKHLPLVVEGQVDSRKFDLLMEDMLETAGTTFVVDNGAATFLPLGHYMAENHAYDVLAAGGVDVTTHCVVTGGQALTDTMLGLDALTKIARDGSVVVWINEFFGPVEHEGTPFHQLPVFTRNQAKFRGTVTLQRRNADTFGADVRDMVSQHLTFREALEAMPVMARTRLKLVQQEVYDQLDAIGLQ